MGSILGRQPLRSLLVSLAVALGVASLAAVLLVNASARRAFHARIEEVAGRAALQVTGPAGGFPEEVREVVRAVPGVATAVPLVEGTAFVTTSGEPVHVFGIDVLDDDAVRTYRTGDGVLIEDPVFFVSTPDSLLLGAELAARLGVGQDERVTLTTPRGVQAFVVRGLLASEGPVRAFGGSFAAMDLYAAERVFGKDGHVDQIDVVLRPDAAVDAVASALSARLPPTLEVERPAARGAEVDRLISAYQVLLVGFGSIALLVALFVVHSTVAVAVAQRQRELGLLRQLGARRHQVMAGIAIRTALLALPGAVLGLGLGVLAAHLLRAPATRVFETAIGLDLAAGRIEAEPAILLIALGAGLAAAALAALVPAFRAARTSPLAAARRVPATGASGPSRRVVGTGLALLLLLPASLVLLGLAPAGERVVAPALVLGNVAFYLGLAVLGPVMVLALTPALRRLLGSLSRGGGEVAGESLHRAPGRTAATLIVLTTALSFMVIAGTLGRSFEASLRSWLDRDLTVDLTVRSARSVSGWIAPPITDDVTAAVAAVPGVAHVLGRRVVTLHAGDEGALLQALDLVPDCERCGVHGLRMAFEAGDAGTAAARVAAGEGVVVSTTLASRRGLRVGDTYALATPAGDLRLPVVGIAVDFTSNVGTVTLARPLYVARFGDRLVNFVNVFLAPGADLETVRAEIGRRLAPTQEVAILTSRTQKDAFVGLVSDAFRFAYVLEALALGVALLGLAQTLLAGALERAHEIGVLRTLGMTRAQLRGAVLLEAGALGLTGTVLGLVAGGVLALSWVRVYFRRILGWPLEVHFSPGVVLLAVASALLVSLAAGLYPARRAAAVSLVESMREE